MEPKAIPHESVRIDAYNHERFIERALLILFSRLVYFEKMETTIVEVA
jgi:hypothetical protein